MKRAFVAVALSVVAVGTLIFVNLGAASAHKTTLPSSVSIHKAGEGKVAGAVSGPKKCRKNRDVSVFKKDPGPDTFIGTSNTGGNRTWGPITVPEPGRYYAHIDAKTVVSTYKHRHTCRADNSAKIRIE